MRQTFTFFCDDKITKQLFNNKCKSTRKVSDVKVQKNLNPLQ